MTYIITPLDLIPATLIVIIIVILFYLIMCRIVYFATKLIRRAIQRIKP